MRRSPLTLSLLVGLLTVPCLLAQSQPLARVVGRVANTAGVPLPGVSVTLESPQLLGERVLFTDVHGVYKAPPVPPGEYEITFQLEGFQTVTRRERLGANMNLTIDARLNLASVADEIVVLGEAVETLSQSTTAAVTVPKRQLDDLPVEKSLAAAIELAPGVGGDAFRPIISGAAAWQNLFTLNGAVLSANTGNIGTIHPLYVPDAIQETTTVTAGVSAEWGRFTGGVVTAITKAGGNRFEGSYRGTWWSNAWNGSNEFTPEDQVEDVQRRDEATVGGRIIRDHLWFFSAAREYGLDRTLSTMLLEIPYRDERKRTGLELKLTGGTASHQAQATYFHLDEHLENIAHGDQRWWAVVVDDGTFNPGADFPETLAVLSYNGVLSPNLFLEAQYGERTAHFMGYGGRDTAIDSGTPIYDMALNVVYNEALWCDSEEVAGCTQDVQDNEQARIQGTGFWSTDRLGSHDVTLGGERFSGILYYNEHFSANDLLVWEFQPSELDFAGGRVYPTIPTGGAFLAFHPILVEATEPDYRTTSFFVNDRWRLDDRWSFNLGLRYDANESVNAAGLKVAEDSAWGPRLGVTYDLGADGRDVFHASYGVYAGPQPEGIFQNNSPAGAPAMFGYLYLGPPIGVDYGNRLDPEAANRLMWDWLAGACPNAIDFSDTRNLLDPFDCDYLAITNIPGLTTVPAPNLGSNTVDELSVGYQRDFGRYGSLRADWVHRDHADFFVVRRDLETGQGVTERGDAFDQGIIVNDDSILEQKYDGLHTAFNFRFLESRLRVGGIHTWFHRRGRGSGASPYGGDDVLEYPEYREIEWTHPSWEDRGHRVRVWVQYDLVDGPRHRLNVSWLENLQDGAEGSYEVAGNVDLGTYDENHDFQPYVENPGYLTPPVNQRYVFEVAPAGTLPSIHRSDLALNYSFRRDRWEIFLQPMVRNLFNEDAVVGVDTTVFTHQSDDSLEPFDPFTEEPVEGVHWRKGPLFGQPVHQSSLQEVRTFELMAGIRFNP